MKEPVLVCPACGRTYTADARRWRCDCGGALDLRFVPSFVPTQTLGRPATLWRYREALPLDGEEAVSLGEPCTPLLPLTFAEGTVLVKQEQLFPTGSYKDRGAAVLMTFLRAQGVRRIVEDSSGNAGSAIAAYAARAGIACDIYVPVGTSPAKIQQIEAYGATAHLIPGPRERAAEAVRAAAECYVYASHVYNPWFLQGTKTFAYETAEQLGWRAPDAVVLPVGNGTLLLGAFIGFRELREAGIINRMPRLIAVQAAGCAPLAKAFVAGSDLPAEITPGATVAEGIAITRPARGAEILAAVRATQGSFITVSEQEIGDSLRTCCQHGWFIEPTAAAAIAGARRYAGAGSEGRTIVTAFTGHGLKAAATVAEILSRDSRGDRP